MIYPLIVTLSFALLLGGGTTAGFGSDVLVQVLSVGALAYLALAMPAETEHFRAVFRSNAGKLTAGIVACLIALYAVQLLPFSQTWFASGPLGGEPSNGSLSRVPHATGAALASLLPPITVFALTLACTAAHRQVAMSVLVFIALASLLLGFLQVAQGPASSLRFFEFTNRTEAVGFFANRNHFASLLCVLLALICVWLLSRINRADRMHILAAAGALACLVAILTGVLLARSRGGLLLAMIVLTITILLYWIDRRRLLATRQSRASPGSRWLFGGLVIAFVIAVQLGLGRMLTRFDTDLVDDLRWVFAESGIALALDSLPSGTGIGSFVQSYAVFERISDLFTGFANRAHNDWIEFAVEGGLPAVILMVIFLIWFGSRLLSGSQNPGLQRQQHLSGALVIVVLLLHSAVDYPLRTTALATVFAFACALLMPPLPERITQVDEEVDDLPRTATTNVGGQKIGSFSPVSDGQHWPEAWRRD